MTRRRLRPLLVAPILVVGLAAGILALVRSGQREVDATDPPPAPSPSPSTTPLDRIVDAGSRVGLPQGVSSWGIAAGDLFGEGLGPDLVVSFHGDIRVYRNEGGGRLSEVFRPDLSDAHDCAIADVTQNGLGDVYCTRGGGAWKETPIRKSNGLWLQEPAGTFSENVARDFGLADPLGRGRHVTFLDLDGDPFPDLFVGNHTPRADGKPSPNRTFLNQGGEGFREVRVGLTAEVGGSCVQAIDADGDGWEDLLVCGNERLYLFRSVPAPDGGRRFRDVSPETGIDLPDVLSAWMGDVDGDGRPDVAVLQRDRVRVLLRRGPTFSEAALDRRLEEGTWVAMGDIDGVRGPDVYVVQGCRGDRNVEDLLFLNDGAGGFEDAEIPQAGSGCGDIAEMVDLDGDGRDEIIVLNGRPVGREGPAQVLTLSPALA